MTLYGYYCWFCAKRFAKSGETPEKWREFMCSMLPGRVCSVEETFWSKPRRKAARAKALP